MYQNVEKTDEVALPGSRETDVRNQEENLESKPNHRSSSKTEASR